MEESEIRERIEKLLAEQRQFFRKQEEDLNELRYLIESRYQQLDKRIEYVLLRLSFKERMKGLILTILGLSCRFNPNKREDDYFNSSSGNSFPSREDKNVEGKDFLIIEHKSVSNEVEVIESLPLEMSIVTNWECNYHCSYCFAYKPRGRSEYRKHEAKEWEKALYSIYEKYGKCRLILTGGEPLFYKDSIDLVIRLTKYHYVSLNTNLSAGIEVIRRIAEESNRENLCVSPSFHLEHASIDQFMDKVRLLKECGIGVWSSAVAHPKYITEMVKIRDKFERNSLGISFFPYIGKYDGRAFPPGYSEGESAILGNLEGWHLRANKDKEPSKKVELPRTKGTLCYTGVKFCSVNPGGEAMRCMPVRQAFANVFDGNFSLLKKPLPCPVEICDCEVYWKYLVR